MTKYDILKYGNGFFLFIFPLIWPQLWYNKPLQNLWTSRITPPKPLTDWHTFQRTQRAPSGWKGQNLIGRLGRPIRLDSIEDHGLYGASFDLAGSVFCASVCFAELELTLWIEIFFFSFLFRNTETEVRALGNKGEEQETRKMEDLAVTSLAVCPAACPESLRINKTPRYTL